MMNKVKETALKVKNHVKENKVAYVMTGVAIGVVVIQQAAVRSWMEFLDEKGINRLEFTNPEMFAEMNSN